MFLAQKDGKIRLMSFKANPWLRRDEYPKSNQENIFKQSIFLFSGVLARPKMHAFEDHTAGHSAMMLNHLIKNSSTVGDHIKEKKDREDK